VFPVDQGRLSSSAFSAIGFGRVFSANRQQKLSQIAHSEPALKTAANCARCYRSLKQRFHVAPRKLEQRPSSAGNVGLSSNGFSSRLHQSTLARGASAMAINSTTRPDVVNANCFQGIFPSPVWFPMRVRYSHPSRGFALFLSAFWIGRS
jgi:hypothetical protein